MSVTAFWICGCVHAPPPAPETVWVKPNATDADYQRQIAVCRNASFAVPSPVYSNGQTQPGQTANLSSAMMDQGTMLAHYAVVMQYTHNCMVAAGWTEEPKP
ncbi:MAG TPA: hypothetical protein VHU23_02165 [Rhizomicrobium sp.]|nr:hypothetical protein [Rhizomicrobium sp.]